MGKNLRFEEIARNCIGLMSHKEKEIFKVYIQAEFPKGSQAKYQELFIGLQRAVLPKNLVPKRFKNPRAVEDGCRQLRIKLIEFLSMIRKQERLEFALTNGFSRYAKDQYKAEYLDAIKEQNIDHIGRLLDLSWKYSILAGFDGFPKTKREETLLRYEKSALGRASLYFAIANEHVNRNLGHVMTDARKKEFEQRREAVDSLDQPYFFPFTRAKIYYTKAIWYLLVRDYPSVQGFLRERLNIMKEHPHLFSSMEFFKTCSTLFKVYVSGNQFDLSKDFLYEMGGLETPGGIHNEAILATWYYLSLTQASSGGDMDLGRMALKRIKDMPDKLRRTEREQAYLSAAVVAVYDQQWEKADYMLKKIPNPYKPSVLLKAGVLGIICPFEQGEVSLARRRAYKYFSTLNQIPGKGNSKISELLEKKILYWCSTEFRSGDLTKEAQEVLDQIVALTEVDETQKKFVKESDLLRWITVKAKGVELLEGIQSGIITPLVSLMVPD